jgi:hypothetical protein
MHAIQIMVSQSAEESLERERKIVWRLSGSERERGGGLRVRIEMECKAVVAERSSLNSHDLLYFVMRVCLQVTWPWCKRFARRADTGLEVKESFGEMALRQRSELVPSSTSSQWEDYIDELQRNNAGGVADSCQEQLKGSACSEVKEVTRRDESSTRSATHQLQHKRA